MDLVESGQLSLHSNYSGWILEVDSEFKLHGLAWFAVSHDDVNCQCQGLELHRPHLKYYLENLREDFVFHREMAFRTH